MSGETIAADQLRLLIERIERLKEEKKGIADDINDVFGEAKSTGFDVKTMREIIRLRAMEKHDRQEAEALLETYKAALGMDDLFAGHDGRRSKTAQGWVDHLAKMDADGIGISIGVPGKPLTPINKTAKARAAERTAKAELNALAEKLAERGR